MTSFEARDPLGMIPQLPVLLQSDHFLASLMMDLNLGGPMKTIGRSSMQVISDFFDSKGPVIFSIFLVMIHKIGTFFTAAANVADNVLPRQVLQ